MVDVPDNGAVVVTNKWLLYGKLGNLFYDEPVNLFYDT